MNALRVAVDAVLGAYERLEIDKFAARVRKTEEELIRLEEEYREDRDRARSQIFEIARSEGTDDLDRRRQIIHDQMARIEGLILELESQLAVVGAAQPGPDAQGALTPEDVAQLTVEQLAASDGQLAALVSEEFQLATALARHTQRGLGPAHRTVLALRAELQATRDAIEERAELVRAAMLEQGATGGATMVAGALETPAQIQARLAKLKELRAERAAEAARLARAQLSLEHYRTQQSDAERWLSNTRARREALQVEQRNRDVGRIEILQTGHVPLRPSSDKRRALAVLGAGAGAAAGLAPFVLAGLIRPRYRYINDLAEGGERLAILGVLPDLSSDDAEIPEIAAASVHHLRSLLDAAPADGLGVAARPMGVVQIVTSAAAGEGKSSLAIALARSFALSGRRTLLLDADLLARSVTTEFDLVAEQGLADAVGRAPHNGVVHATGMANLWVMPVGGPDAPDRLDPERLPPRQVEALLASLREQFDNIVVDTGPILGSLEANIVSGVSDRILLVVSRGQEARLVRAAMDRLRRLGAADIGIVFNRARSHDIRRSTSVVSASERSTAAVTSGGGNGSGGRMRPARFQIAQESA